MIFDKNKKGRNNAGYGNPALLRPCGGFCPGGQSVIVFMFSVAVRRTAFDFMPLHRVKSAMKYLPHFGHAMETAPSVSGVPRTSPFSHHGQGTFLLKLLFGIYSLLVDLSCVCICHAS